MQITTQLPAGTVIMYAGATAPDGFLLCNGAAINRLRYKNLFAAITTAWGGGDGSTTFNLPDFRNVFPRGANDAARVIGGVTYPASPLAGFNADKFQGHRHAPYPPAVSFWSELMAGPTIGAGAVAFAQVPTTGDPVTDTVNGVPRVGATTEPQNLGINFIISTGEVNKTFHG